MDHQLKYTAIIVIYNKSVADSVTCDCIDKLKSIDLDVLIVDNSTSDYNNAIECEKRHYKYISMGGNKGLSKAYNVAIDNSEADILIFFDDDTEISEDYFTVLKESVNNNWDIDIFAPIVYGQDGVIYSPNEFNFLRNKFISSPQEEINPEKFNAIASCLAVRKKVFESYRFDETLFVDQVDQYFFCQQRSFGRKFMKINTSICQNFYQRGEILTPEAGWRRVRLRLVDVMRHAKLMQERQYYILGFIKCVGLSVQIAIKTKSINVLLKGMVLSVRLLFNTPMTN